MLTRKKIPSLCLYAVYLILAAEVLLRLGSHFLFKVPLLDIRRLRSDPYVIWKFNPGYTGPLYTYTFARINRNGFLGNELEKPKGRKAFRVVVLGGSVAFGYGVASMEENFCSQLENILNDSSAGWSYEVVNAGVPGYSSWNGRQFVEHYLADLQPDFLLVAFGWNDSLLDLLPDGHPQKGMKSVHNNVAHFPFSHSVTAYALRRAYLILGAKMGLIRNLGEEEHRKYPVRVSPEQLRENLRAMRDWCDDHGVEIALCTEPVAKLPPGVGARTDRYSTYSAAVRQAAAELGVPLADVAGAFSEMDPKICFAHPEIDYVHPNAQGQKEMAGIVYHQLRQAGCFTK